MMKKLAFMVCLLALQGAAFADDANFDARILGSLDACLQALNGPASRSHNTQARPEEIRIINWNIMKGSRQGWRDDLLAMSSGAHFLFLQEAVDRPAMLDAGGNHYWHFTPGFGTSSYRSGLLTSSSFRPDFSCNLESMEPWLRTPKMAGITHIPLPAMATSLLLVNVHQINFTLGVKAFTEQLEQIETIMAQHDGPVIFSGDFNTWRPGRLASLEAMIDALALEPITFPEDFRKTVFGQPLDYMFVRGFEVKDSTTIQLESSDHNPMVVTLRFAGDRDV